MQPLDCPAFDYSKHPERDRLLLAASVRLLRQLWLNSPPLPRLTDTRPVHGDLFKGLCPVNYEYFAGHYRGEEYRCLKSYAVGVHGDPRVGYPPERVRGTMADLARSIEANLAALDAASEQPTLSAAQKLVFVVAYACRLFVEFLTIHPYADGNGHVARWLLIGTLGKQGYLLKDFPIEPSPDRPLYLDMIFRHRNGEVEVLELYVLRKISPAVRAK